MRKGRMASLYMVTPNYLEGGGVWKLNWNGGSIYNWIRVTQKGKYMQVLCSGGYKLRQGPLGI